MHEPTYDIYKQPQYEKKFAWTPVRTTIGDYRIWLTYYYIRHTFYDQLGRPPMKGLSWKLILSEEQYFLLRLQGKL